MLRIAICDDNPDVIPGLLALAKQGAGEEPAEFFSYSDPENLIIDAESGERLFDIVILDVLMPKMDGISAAKKLNGILPGCRIIFVSFYVEYGVDVYEAEHFRFVTKDRANELLPKAVSMAIREILKDSTDYIGVQRKRDAGLARIPTGNILYMERHGRETEIHTDGETVCTAMHPDKLLEGKRQGLFIQCHQSFWVNAGRIREMEGNEFILDNGAVIRVSRNYKTDAKKQFLSHLFQ